MLLYMCNKKISLSIFPDYVFQYAKTNKQTKANNLLRNKCTNVTQTTDKVKLARFWMTLAVNVRVRRVFGSGYGCVRPKREGLRIAGHKKRRKREAEMSRWPISGLPWSSHTSTQLEKILFNSSGKGLVERSMSSMRSLNVRDAQIIYCMLS